MRSFFFGSPQDSAATRNDFPPKGIRCILGGIFIWVTGIILALCFYSFEFMRLASWLMSFVAITVITTYVRFGKFMNRYDQGPVYLWKRILFWTTLAIFIVGFTALVCVNFHVAKALMMKVAAISSLVYLAAIILMLSTPDCSADTGSNQRWRYGIRRGLLVAAIILIALGFLLWFGIGEFWKFLVNLISTPVK